MTVTEQDDLREQKALVTGATSGIGRAIAVQLARMGAEVLVHGRDATRGGEVVEEIERAGGRARFVAADLSNPADLQRRQRRRDRRGRRIPRVTRASYITGAIVAADAGRTAI